ncbi:hypothetical protein CR513_22017, partial [Mucuna pruriens]
MGRGAPPSPFFLPHNPSLLHKRDTFPLDFRYGSCHPRRDRRTIPQDHLVPANQELGRIESEPRPIVKEYAMKARAARRQARRLAPRRFKPSDLVPRKVTRTEGSFRIAEEVDKGAYLLEQLTGPSQARRQRPELVHRIPPKHEDKGLRSQPIGSLPSMKTKDLRSRPTRSLPSINTKDLRSRPTGSLPGMKAKDLRNWSTGSLPSTKTKDLRSWSTGSLPGVKTKN